MTQKNIIRGQAVSKEKIALAKEFRRNANKTEKILWQKLRTDKLGGLHFRRQQVLFGYIADFYCHAASLIIEVDGGIHSSHVAEDQEREAVLKEKGFTVLRFRNSEIESDVDLVLSKIIEECRKT